MSIFTDIQTVNFTSSYTSIFVTNAPSHSQSIAVESASHNPAAHACVYNCVTSMASLESGKLLELRGIRIDHVRTKIRDWCHRNKLSWFIS